MAFLGSALRRPLVVLVPFVGVAVIAALGSLSMLNQYRSEASILIMAQEVPNEYVRSTISAKLEERLHSISQQILSHASLEQLVREFDLYPQARTNGAPDEEAMAKMKRSVVVQIAKGAPRRNDGTLFQVSFSYTDPVVAQKVTERLAALFISENLQEREATAKATNAFLEQQLAETRERLIEQEQLLKEYRAEHSGELPSQLEYNARELDRLQARIGDLDNGLTADRRRRAVLERLLAEASAASTMVTADNRAVTVNSETATRLQAAVLELQTLELQLKAEHPDVVRQRRKIRELQAQLAAESTGAVETTPRPVTRDAIERQARITEMRAEMAGLDRDIVHRENEVSKLRNQVVPLQRRIEATPAREAELVGITRDYQALQDHYNTLLNRSQDSKVAANLESNRIAEQFRMIEPPRVPKRPYSPDRMRITLIGALIGLALGFGISALLEYQNNTLRTEDEVKAALGLPVLATVPLMSSSSLARPSFRRRALGWSSAVLIMGGALVRQAWKTIG
jgi:polysaccharide chain length determinant protein (PEP-CTERM system associated)